MHGVMIQPSDYAGCRKSVDAVFDAFSPDLAGKKVLIKPNVLRASGPDEGIVTHPAVLGAVVDAVLEAGPAEVVVGDNPGAMSYGANEESFQKTGLAQASRGHYRNIGGEAVEVPFNPAFCDQVKVSAAVMDADIVISLPKFKTHGLTTLTGAIKNSYGFLPGAQKAKLHAVAGDPWRFGELIVDVFQVKVPALFILDAVVGMEGNGPASKDLRRIGKIMAADNAVALDATVARMMGANPGHIRFLEVARARGLGEWDPEAIEILGQLEPLADFKLPPMAVKAEDVSPEIREMLYRHTLLRPAVDEALCTGCGTCVEQCPAAALSMENGLPQVDKSKCITCFCCQEACPETAIRLG